MDCVERRSVDNVGHIYSELPDDLWEIIFGYLNRDHHRRLAPVSLVSKRFLAISNRARTSLSLIVPFLRKEASTLSIYSRFHLIRTVKLRCDDDELLDSTIIQLAQSNLPLKTLHLHSQDNFPQKAMRFLGQRMSKTLRSLSCTQFQIMTDDDIAILTDFFPYIEELDIENSGWAFFPRSGAPHVADQGILAISLKLKSLVSLNFCSQFSSLSPRSFEYLADHCPSLCELHATVTRNCPIGLDYVLTSFNSLASLHLWFANITENVLDRLSRAQLKIRKLVLSKPNCSKDVTGATVCRFLKSCCLLRHLELAEFDFPTDITALDFATSIPHIQVIQVITSSFITYPLPQTFLFNLLNACPNLIEIAIAGASLASDHLFKLPVRYPVRKMVLSKYRRVSDEIFGMISSICPLLETLYVTDCFRITEQGLHTITKSCKNIKLIEVSKCLNFDNFYMNENIPHKYRV